MSVEANDLTIEDEVNLEPKKPGMPSCSTNKFTLTFELGFMFLRFGGMNSCLGREWTVEGVHLPVL